MMSSEKNPTRERILKATWKLLENGGASNVRMSDFAKAAGISRQALYLHFPNRAELLVETTLYIDEVSGLDDRLNALDAETPGIAGLQTWVEIWGNYIPTIYGIAKALMALKDTDAEAAAAWDNRMDAVRRGCAEAVSLLVSDGDLRESLSEEEAVDILWTLVSVRNWEHLRQDCGWSQERYISWMLEVTGQALVRLVDD